MFPQFKHWGMVFLGNIRLFAVSQHFSIPIVCPIDGKGVPFWGCLQAGRKVDRFVEVLHNSEVVVSLMLTCLNHIEWGTLIYFFASLGTVYPNTLSLRALAL